MSLEGSTESALQRLLPEEWGSKQAWLESAYRAGRMLRRDVARATPQQIRQAIELASRLNPGPWGGEFHEREGNGWQGAEVTWKEHDEGTVVWMHGGAFAFGSPRVYRAAAVHLARVSRCRVVLPQYRLAPEHAFPAAHDDAYQALKGVVAERQHVVLLGDSAGGNLAMSAMERWCGDGMPSEAIKGLALLSPWCDLREEADSIEANAVAHSPFNHKDSLDYSAQYLAGHSAKDPLVSPLLSASCDSWPGVYLEWAMDEFLAPDIQALQRKLDAAKVPVTERTEEQAVHGWQLLPDLLPEARRSSLILGEWVRRRLGLQTA